MTTKTPSIEAMKLAVAKMLPEKIEITACMCHTGDDPYLGPRLEWIDCACWIGGDEAIRETEWLHVCWLAEKTLTREQCHDYHNFMRDPLHEQWFESGREVDAMRWTFHASVEHRLEALCRVKFPEMFREAGA